MLKTFFNVQVGFFNYLKQTREREKTWVIVSPDVTIFSISFFLSLDWCLTCIWHSSFSILIGALKSTYLFLSLSLYSWMSFYHLRFLCDIIFSLSVFLSLAFLIFNVFLHFVRYFFLFTMVSNHYFLSFYFLFLSLFFSFSLHWLMHFNKRTSKSNSFEQKFIPINFFKSSNLGLPSM